MADQGETLCVNMIKNADIGRNKRYLYRMHDEIDISHPTKNCNHGQTSQNTSWTMRSFN